MALLTKFKTASSCDRHSHVLLGKQMYTPSNRSLPVVQKQLTSFAVCLCLWVMMPVSFKS